MKGFFSKLMNKINDLPNPEGIKTTPKNANESQTQANSPAQKPAQPPNYIIKDNAQNKINKNQNTINTVSNVNTINNVNTVNNNQNNKSKTDQIVIVNERQEEKKQGYYYKKHIEDIRKLKISEPIIYQRQKMKVNFDLDILDYLFNDMTEIFKQKSNVVEENKNELIKKINETYDLVNVLSELNKNSDDIMNKYMKQKDIMDNVEVLEIFIKSLSQEVDDLLSDIAKFESKMKNESNENDNDNDL